VRQLRQQVLQQATEQTAAGVHGTRSPTPVEQGQLLTGTLASHSAAAARVGWSVSQLPAQLRPGSSYTLASGPAAQNENLLIVMHGLGDRPAPFARLGSTLNLPQTAILALAGPLVVPETDGGRAWFTAFDEQSWDLIQVAPRPSTAVPAPPTAQIRCLHDAGNAMCNVGMHAAGRAHALAVCWRQRLLRLLLTQPTGGPPPPPPPTHTPTRRAAAGQARREAAPVIPGADDAAAAAAAGAA